MNCKMCSAPLKPGAKFCTRCGARIEGESLQKIQPVSRPGRQMAAGNQYSQAGTKKKSSGIIWILLGILIILLGILGGLLFFKWKGSLASRNDGKKAAVEKVLDQEMSEAVVDEEKDQETSAAEEAVESEEAVSVPESGITASMKYLSEVNTSGMMIAAYKPATMIESSHLVQSDTPGAINDASMAFDNNVTTSWQVRTDNHGIGEYLGISFDRTYRVKCVAMNLGSHRTKALFEENNMPSKITVEIGEEKFQTDVPKEMMDLALEFSEPVSADKIKITIDDVYLGTLYDDTVVAEIRVFGYPSGTNAGEWKQDNRGWWYDYGGGSFLTDGWQEIDGKYYYFDHDGYILVNTTTPDGYSVDENGVRTETQDGNAYSTVSYDSFYGVWGGASTSKTEGEKLLEKAKNSGFPDAQLFLTSEWSNLNSRPFYAVSYGVYGSIDEAKAILPAVKSVCSDAYVKYSGEYVDNAHN